MNFLDRESMRRYFLTNMDAARRKTMTTEKKPHVHAEVIKAWAENSALKIQWRYGGKDWKDCDTVPAWDVANEYRIKPEEPAKVYPETQLDARALHAIFITKQDPTYYSGLTAIANAALRHAIDVGQVVIPEPPTSTAISPNEDDPAEIAYWNFDARKKGYFEWKGRQQSERNAFKAEYRAALSAVFAGQSKRLTAARDMAVAAAVRIACRKCRNYEHIDELDLAAIIAQVPA